MEGLLIAAPRKWSSAAHRCWEMDDSFRTRDALRVAPSREEEGGGSKRGPSREQIRRAANGSTSDQRVVFEFVSPRVIGICRRIMGPSHPTVEDAMQETLVGVLKGLSRLESAENLGAYAARIAVRTAIRAAKKSRKLQTDEEAVGLLKESSKVSPSAQLLAERRKRLVREMLEELPDGQSEAIAGQVVLGLSLEETAEQLGVPVNTVRSRVRAAKNKMKEMILKNPRYKELLE